MGVKSIVASALLIMDILRYYSIVCAPKVGSSGLGDFFLLENHARYPLPLVRATHELPQK
jgi:hypothetical protein